MEREWEREREREDDDQAMLDDPQGRKHRNIYLNRNRLMHHPLPITADPVCARHETRMGVRLHADAAHVLC